MSATTPASSATISLVNPSQASSSSMHKSNPVLECLLSHSSDRSYKPDPIDEAILDQILSAGLRAPTSCNSHDVTVIVVKDPQRKQRVAELADNQLWIAQCPVFLLLCGDYHKVEVGMELFNSSKPAISETLEGIMTICTDAGIALQAMMLAARSFGLGCVPIGGLRGQITELSKFLEVPPYVVPVLGLCIGHVEKHAPLKPRMDPSVFIHHEKYNADQKHLEKVIRDYDQVMEEHWKKVKRADGQKWSESISGIYYRNYRPNLRAEMQTQRFEAN